MDVCSFIGSLIAISLMLNSAYGQESKLRINISTDNSFNVSVSEKEWFRSGPVSVRNKGAWLNSTDGSLILNGTYGASGEDALGTYQYIYYDYHDNSGGFRFTTFIKVYEEIDVITFGHTFVSGAEEAATDTANGVISSFPSILVEDNSMERGYVTFGGSSKSNIDIDM